MIVRRLVAHGVLLATLLPLHPARAAESCARLAEHRALDVRVLQTRLMVAALTCGYQRDYNHVVTDLRPLFAGEAVALRGYFARRYGRGSERELDSFVTRLANEEANISAVDRARYCTTRRALIAHLRSAGGLALHDAKLNAELSAGHRVARCAPVRTLDAARSAAAVTPR